MNHNSSIYVMKIYLKYDNQNSYNQINNNMKNFSIIFAVLGGAVAGAAIGLLFAPEKGVETRKSIRDYVKSKCPLIKKDRLDEIVDEIAAEIKK